MNPATEAALAQCQSQFDASLERLLELLRIPSISTDPAHAGDVRRAAEWLVTELAGLGFAASARPTEGHPMVVAHADGPEGAPHVLFYAHYDVQPVDPLEEWRTPPFAPAVGKGADGVAVIGGRGASDDKGQLMTFVEACRAGQAAGGLPVRVTLLLEGEEESGSKSLVPFLNANRDELAADVALICDTSMWDRRTPAITATLRGMVAEEVEITAASRDLHSGLYGGAACNPIHLLAAILAEMHDAEGRVTLPGFYDGVDEPPEGLRAEWQGLGFAPSEFLGGVGLSVPAGEAGRSVLEQIWARPTAEVNGIWGGYTGAGFKTVIPAKASAKVSFRLVGRQDPRRVAEAFRDFVTGRLPADCSARFTAYAGNAAVVLPYDGAWLTRAKAALAAEWGRPAATVGSGGSIPVAGDFKRILGLDSLMIGFAQDDDRIHSPNEKYDLDSYRRGIRSWARILGAFAG